MTLRLYITGHGEWRPIDGYIKVPKNCTFMAPIKFGKVMADSDVRTLLAGDWKRKPEIVVNQYKTIPNYRWHPLTPTERKKDLFAFEFYRKETAKINKKFDATFHKSIIPKQQPYAFKHIASRSAPKITMTEEELQAQRMQEYKPGFIHSGDSMVLYPDKGSPGNASAIISCPKNTVLTLDEILKSMHSIIQTAVKNYGDVEIIWACCQALTLARVHSVDRITNQVDSIGGYMHMDDLEEKKKLIIDPKLKVDFKYRKKHTTSICSNINDLVNDDNVNNNYQMIKTIGNIKKMLIKNGLRI